MDNFWETAKNVFESNWFQSILAVIVSFCVYKFINHIATKSKKKDVLAEKLNSRSKTYMKLISSIIKYVFLILTILVVLKINGVNISSMLAGVGIAGVIIGLAIQDVLKDVIRGFNIVSDNYFSVGDIIIFNGITGKVLSVGIRTTTINELSTGNIVSISNRNIEQVQVLGGTILFEIPLSYELKFSDAEKAINKIVEEIKKNEDCETAEYLGPNELADSSIKYMLKLTCEPEKRYKVKRDAIGCVLKTLEKEGIEIPYNQLDIHQK